MIGPRAILRLLGDTYSKWKDDRASRMAAALAYYAIFSIGPMLLIAVSVAGLVYGEDAARGVLAEKIEGLVGYRAAEAIQTILNGTSVPSSSVVATALGVVMVVLGATGMLSQLQDALDTVWGLEPRTGRGLRGFAKDRLLAIAMVLGLGLFLMASLAMSTTLAALTLLADRLGGLHAGILLQTGDLALSFVTSTVLFALAFKALPDTRIAWGDVWLGSAFTALLFAIGKLAIGWYVTRAAIGSTYGAAGSMIVLLIWIYYSAQIALFGAALTQVYAHRHGSRASAPSSADSPVPASA